MALTKLAYNGDSKIIKNLVNQVNQLIDGGGGASSLVDLEDTNISNPSNGQVLEYDSQTSKWKNANPPASGVSDVKVDGTSVVTQGVANITTPDLDDLESVDISSPSNGQVLEYDNQTQKWKNATPSGGGNVDDVKVNGTSVVDVNKIAQITSYKEVTLAEYIALGDAVNTDGKLYCITDLNNSDVQGYPPLIYSDEEREVGIWRDGKPLYQKTIALNNLSVTNNQWAKTNESATNIETIVDGFLVDNQSPSQTFQCDIGVDGGKVAVLTWFVGNSARTMSYLTFRYTKTTDVAGSGIWNGQGGIAHHYSTSEKIIGTWIDGKPIYEKTWEFSSDISCSVNTWIDTPILSDNIKNIIDAKVYNAEAKNKWGCVNVHITNDSQYIQIQNTRTISAISVRIVTLQYTKTTD